MKFEEKKCSIAKKQDKLGDISLKQNLILTINCFITENHLLVNEKMRYGWLNSSLKSTETRDELSTT